MEAIKRKTKAEKLQDSIQKRLESNSSTVEAELEKMEYINENLMDYIVTSDRFGIELNEVDEIEFDFGAGIHSLHFHAIGQFAQKFKIPTKYLRDLLAGSFWKKNLGTTIVYRHSIHDKKRLLLRTVDNEVRGIVSDSYRRMDSRPIFEAFIEEASNYGGLIWDAHCDDTRSFIEIIIPMLIKVPTLHNGAIYMAFGLRLSNSQFGDGALDLREFAVSAESKNCTVGKILNRQIHRGKKLPDSIQISQTTHSLETLTQAHLVRDLTRSCLKSEYILEFAERVKKASSKEIDMNMELTRLPKMGLIESEVKKIEQVLIADKKKDGLYGGSTLWKLSQAVSSVAKKEGGRRQREMEEISGKLLFK